MTRDVPRDAFAIAAACVRIWVRGLVALCSGLFCLAVLTLTFDIASRLAVHASVRGTHEIVVVLFVWIFMLGTAALYARNEDVVMTIVVRNLPRGLRVAVACAVCLTIAAAMALLFSVTLRLIYEQRHVVSADLRIPDWLRFAPMLLAAASMTVTGLLGAWAAVLEQLTGHRRLLWDATAAAHGHQPLPPE